MTAAESILRARRTSTLRHTVSNVISDRPSRAAVTDLVERSHRYALAYLVKKSRSGGFHSGMFGLSLKDLALDSIADLFKREQDGTFTVLREYFRDSIRKGTTEVELQIALRRLVFSRVNESLFRRYRESDANLSKIIRNVKDAAKASTRLDLARRNGQTWLVVCSPARNGLHENADTRPIAPPEVLEAFFTGEIATYDRVRDLAGRFAFFVEAHPFYAAGYPLVPFARALRAAYFRLKTPPEPNSSDELVIRHEIEKAIHDASLQVMHEKRRSYVGRGKVSVETYDAYFCAVRDILAGEYFRNVDTESFFSALSDHMPETTETEYRRDHRNILEYLVKLSRSRLLDHMQAQA